MSELKLRVSEANNEALTRHFLKLLCRIEERVEFLEVKLEELQSHLLWLEKELCKVKTEGGEK